MPITIKLFVNFSSFLRKIRNKLFSFLVKTGEENLRSGSFLWLLPLLLLPHVIAITVSLEKERERERERSKGGKGADQMREEGERGEGGPRTCVAIPQR